MSASSPQLQLRGIYTAYDKADVLTDVSLAVESGRITCILGSNGSGKSTLIRSILGLTRPRRGTIRLGELDITRLPTHLINKAGIACIPEGRKVFPKLTVEENLLVGAYRERAKAGEDFAALAKQYSKDPGSAAVGGDLNFFPKEQMVPPFSAAAFAMKPGEISNLVETQFGLHIIKVTDRRVGRTVPLAEVSDRLSNFLKQRRQQELMQQYLQGLKAKYRVEILI
jgi:ABC-type Fe3+/spermidine/putrescine transport system ATPase subunit